MGEFKVRIRAHCCGCEQGQRSNAGGCVWSDHHYAWYYSVADSDGR